MLPEVTQTVDGNRSLSELEECPAYDESNFEQKLKRAQEGDFKIYLSGGLYCTAGFMMWLFILLLRVYYTHTEWSESKDSGSFEHRMELCKKFSDFFSVTSVLIGALYFPYLGFVVMQRGRAPHIYVYFFICSGLIICQYAALNSVEDTTSLTFWIGSLTYFVLLNQLFFFNFKITFLPK